MRRFLISALFLSLLAGCSSLVHHIDVQQGNALDQESVARLKTGLNRSQVRFLLGTPLVVDPFRNDRWDYVYLYYKAGKLTEQKHIALFFEGDTLVRIEGDLPAPPATPAGESGTEPQPAAVTPAVSAPAAAPLAAEPAPVVAAPAAAPVATPVGQTEAAKVKPVEQAGTSGTEPATQPAAGETSVVAPLPSPKNVPAYVDPHPAAELSLKPETDVAQIKSDAIPAFPGSRAAASASDDPVLKSVHAWADAWARHDDAAYFAAYDAGFVPQDGGSRATWEARKRQALGAGKNIEVKIDSPSVERTGDGTATVTFKQYYRSGSYHDAVVKELRMVERDGRWLIAEEKVLSVLKDGRP